MYPSSGNKPTKKHYFALSIGFISLLLLWIIISALENNEILFPSLFATLQSMGLLFTKSHTYLVILNSVGGVFLVLIISVLCALFFALLSLKFSPLKSFLAPTFSLFKIIPIPALIIFLLANMRQSFIPYLLTFIATLPLVYDGLYGAFISINKDIIDDLRLLSPLNFKMIFKVYIPLISKNFISTLLQAIGLGLKIKVMSEFISEAPNTIGYELSYARATLMMESVFAWSLILIIIVIIFDIILLNLLKKSV